MNPRPSSTPRRRPQQKRIPLPAVRSFEPRKLFALWIDRRRENEGPVVVPENTVEALRAAFVEDITPVLRAARIEAERCAQLAARIDGTDTAKAADRNSGSPPIRALDLLAPFLAGLDIVPERAGVVTTARAIQRLRSIVADHAIPYEARAAIAHELAPLCPWVRIDVPKYQPEDLALAFKRFLAVQRSLGEIASEAAGSPADWVGAAEAARGRVDEMNSDLSLSRTRTPVPTAVIRVEEMMRSVFDDALTDATFADAARVWLVRRRESGADGEVATAYEIVATVFGKGVESVKGAVLKFDKRRGATPIDRYAETLHSKPRAHPAFWFWMGKDWAVFDYLRRWVTFEHAPWGTSLRRPATTRDDWRVATAKLR